METKIKSTPKYKSVLDGYVNVTQYIAEDGKVFTDKSEAEKYEKQLVSYRKWNEIDRVDVSNLNEVGPAIHMWYRPKNEEELKMLKEAFYVGKGYCTIHSFDGKLKVGEWMGCDFIDNGDYHATYEVYTYEYLKYDVMSYFEVVESKMKEKEGRKD